MNNDETVLDIPTKILTSTVNINSRQQWQWQRIMPFDNDNRIKVGSILC